MPYSAKMQSLNWNDLKFLLTLYRTGKLKASARVLGTSETTVSRRIKALEQNLGVTLFLGSAFGRYEPTDAALQILSHAEAIETESLEIGKRLDATKNQIAGSVRISSVPIIVNRLLVPSISVLSRGHPNLTIELIPSADNLDLSKREADLALRFARPASGGLRTIAQKIGELSFDVFAPASVPPQDADGLSWVTYAETQADLAQARWLEAVSTRDPGQHSGVKVADAETALEAVANGLGKSLLPSRIATLDPRLRTVAGAAPFATPVREVWLLSHADQTSKASITVTKEWLAALFVRT